MRWKPLHVALSHGVLPRSSTSCLSDIFSSRHQRLPGLKRACSHCFSHPARSQTDYFSHFIRQHFEEYNNIHQRRNISLQSLSAFGENCEGIKNRLIWAPLCSQTHSHCKQDEHPLKTVGTCQHAKKSNCTIPQCNIVPIIQSTT